MEKEYFCQYGIQSEGQSSKREYLQNYRLRRKRSWAHTCNPIYSGGRDQEDGGLKPAQENSSHNYLKKPITKTDWWSGSRRRS
jgi:hypothetical protein